MKINKYIDHTLLKASTTKYDIEKLCKEAREWDFASVCILPQFVPLAKELLAGTDTKVGTVIGFPLGAVSSAIKIAETWEALENSCDELDMVINVGALKEGRADYVYNEIFEISNIVKDRTLKVIIETGLLTDYEKIIATKIACDGGADFVKTCTGFSEGKATPEDVMLIKSNTDMYIGVGIKASGGIRTYHDAVALIEAGATRIGTSSGVKIMQEYKKMQENQNLQ